MPRYIAFIDEPVRENDFRLEFPPNATQAEITREVAEAVGMENPEWYYTMGKFYAVVLFEASDNQSAEQVVQKIRRRADVRAEVVPAFTPSELER